MNKSELVAAIAAKSGLSRADAGKALTAFCDVVGETLGHGGEVQITGFGSSGVRGQGSGGLCAANCRSLQKADRQMSLF